MKIHGCKLAEIDRVAVKTYNLRHYFLCVAATSGILDLYGWQVRELVVDVVEAVSGSEDGRHGILAPGGVRLGDLLRSPPKAVATKLTADIMHWVRNTLLKNRPSPDSLMGLEAPAQVSGDWVKAISQAWWNNYLVYDPFLLRLKDWMAGKQSFCFMLDLPRRKGLPWVLQKLLELENGFKIVSPANVQQSESLRCCGRVLWEEERASDAMQLD